MRHTPLLHSRSLTAAAGVDVFLKAECLQHTGSFKLRGATNRIALLTEDEQRRGVVTASAGNHAQGVAMAAARAGVPATVVMPEHASIAKVAATKALGATVLLAGESFEQARAEAQRLAAQDGLVVVPAFDDPLVVAGQGTLGLEIVEDRPDVATVLVPAGGGGLASGVAVAVKSLKPDVEVLVVQAANAPGVAESLERGEPVQVRPHPTLADGVAVAGPGQVTFPLLHRYVDRALVVEEDQIARAMVHMLERSKLVVEGAGAVGVAALLAGATGLLRGPVVVVLSGGNVDINLLARVVEHGLQHAGRYLSLSVGLDDRPGELVALLRIISEAGANVLDVEHHRWGIEIPVGRVQVSLLLEVRDQDHSQALIDRLSHAGFTRTHGHRPAEVRLEPVAWQGG